MWHGKSSQSKPRVCEGQKEAETMIGEEGDQQRGESVPEIEQGHQREHTGCEMCPDRRVGLNQPLVPLGPDSSETPALGSL